MPRIVVSGAVFECSHGGKVRVTGGDATLRVSGAAVLTAGMELGVAFGAAEAPLTGMLAPCPVRTTTTPSAPSPCSATMAALAGRSKQLWVNGSPALLETARGSVVNAQSPGATWSISDPGQSRLEAG